VAEYLTPKQVAEELKVDRLTIYRMIHDGRLPASRVGKRGLRISREALAAAVRPVKSCE
jgi:excisionase family DNA binding protein